MYFLGPSSLGALGDRLSRLRVEPALAGGMPKTVLFNFPLRMLG
jgi:hypothetical protein